MTEQTTGPAESGGAPATGLSNAEKLTALQAYIKALKPMEDELRAEVTREMGERNDERRGAYLPGGEKIGAITYSQGRQSARVTDNAAALAWCLKQHPGAIVQSISPAFLKSLTDYAARQGKPGEPGVDPETGEVLDFITVSQGAPYITVTPTKDGVARMSAIAHSFAGMLEPPAAEPVMEPEPQPVLQPGWPTHVRRADPWDIEPAPWDMEEGK